MPGPVSDSYDPEFGTASNADNVREAVEAMRDRVSEGIGDQTLLNIVDLVHLDEPSPLLKPSITLGAFSERELRVIRFALNRALESL